MIPSATTASMEKITSWMTICRVIRMSRPLIPAIRLEQRVTARWRDVMVARAWHLADGAAPEQLHPRQIALEPCSGEEPLVDAAQRHVDDQRQIRVVASNPVGQRLFRERERRQEAERPGERRPGVGQLFERWAKVFELLDEGVLVWSTESAASALNLPSCTSASARLFR